MSRGIPEMDMADQEKPDFKPLGVVMCPHCGTSNLNWRLVCNWCHEDLESESVSYKKEAELA